MNDDDDDKIRSSTLKIFFGCLILAICILFLRDGFPLSIDKYRLILSTQRLVAQAHQAYEIPRDCNEGGCWSGWYVEYLFRLPGTSTVLNGSSQLSGEMPDLFAEENLPQEIEIEYVPSHPHLSKVVGSGEGSFWRVFVGDIMGLVLILSVLIVGGFLVFSGAKTIWNYPLNPLHSVFGTLARLFYGIGFFVSLGFLAFIISSILQNIFTFSPEKSQGLTGIVFLLLFPLSLFVQLKFLEIYERRKSARVKS